MNDWSFLAIVAQNVCFIAPVHYRFLYILVYFGKWNLIDELLNKYQANQKIYKGSVK